MPGCDLYRLTNITETVVPRTHTFPIKCIGLILRGNPGRQKVVLQKCDPATIYLFIDRLFLNVFEISFEIAFFRESIRSAQKRLRMAKSVR